MDRSLDEILADQRQQKNGRPRGGRGGQGDRGQRRREPRNDFPRDGVRKSYRDDGPRNLDSEWVHDRFEDNGRKPRQQQRGRDQDFPDANGEEDGTKVRVDNVHYDLSEEDLRGLFSQIGTVLKLDISYDRAGRSTGSVFVTYENQGDAQEAVREFDGANAKGQPIRLKVLPPRRRNGYDTAVGGGRPLAERVSVSGARNRSRSPGRDYADEASRKNIDRYVPGGRRSRSPIRTNNRRRGGEGRRPGARRDGGGRENAERKPREGARPKKTQEELDAEMEDYFTGQAAANSGGQAAGAQAVAEEDIDMIE